MPQQPPVVRNEVSFDMESAITGRTYRMWVFVPAPPAPPEGYPVMFITDGAVNFRTAADQLWGRQLVDLKPAILVGVGYPNPDLWDSVRLRSWDLTPQKPAGKFLPTFEEWAAYGNYTTDDAGGAELFYRFITEELRPRLAQEHSIDLADQALYGHSLGGLFTLHTLFNHPEAFSTYVASSPSIAYNERAILADVPAFQAKVERGEVSPRILFATGGLEGKPAPEVLATMPTETIARWEELGWGIDNMLALADTLRAIKGGPRYSVSSVVLADENHMSVTAATVTRALGFAFSR